MFAIEVKTNFDSKLKTTRRNFFAALFNLRKISVYLFVFFAAIGFFTISAQAQTQLVFNDAAPTLETGTALSQGARYRFHTIAPNTDALVTITTVSNATLLVLDDNTSFPERFQPTIRNTAANSTGYIRFDFQLVTAGNSTAQVIPNVYISAQDIDGDGTTNGSREFVEFVNMGTVSVANPTLLTSAAALLTGGVRYIQIASSNNQAGIGTDNRYEMYSTVIPNSSTFTILGGSAVGGGGCGGACDRLNSYAFDAAAANQPTPAPDVSITKTGPASVNQNGIVTYTLVAKNNGPTTANGATVTDNVPASLTNVSITCAATGGAVCPSTTGLTTLNSIFISTFPNGGQVTFTISGTAPNSGIITNVATVVPPNGSTDPNIANNTSAIITTTILTPDLTISKSHTGNFIRGGSGTYSITVTNSGTAATSGAITVQDTLPAGMTVNNGAIGSVTTGGTNAANWTCNSNNASPQIITCTSSTVIPFTAGGNTNIFTLSVNIGAATASSVINSVTVSGGSEPAVNNGNNSANDAANIVSIYSLSGTIFEDANYAGGAGRSLTTSGGNGRGGATVELYNSSGAFVSSTTTTASGQYQFTNLSAGTYTVRVVNSTVSAARSGYVSTLIGVQIFRTNAGAADPNRVGGEDPTKIDAAANTAGAALSALTIGANTPQSISSATISNADVSGVDFGYNFDTVVNIADAGQGSLRQFVTNANALSGADTTIFMISDGAAHAGLRAGLTNQLNGGVAVITLASLLPAINDALTTIDGTTQTNNIGNTNSGSFGTGGAVGVDNLSLSTVQRPEVQITDNGTNPAVGLDLQGANETVRGAAIFGFGTTANNDTSANIRIGANAVNALIEQNILGSTATAFIDPGAVSRSTGDNVRSVGADNGILRNNLIGFSAGKGFGVENGSTGWLIENNEIRGNAIGNANLDGIDLESGATTNNTVRGNLIYENEGVGIDTYTSNGSNTIQNNTVTGNGIGTGANVESPGIRLHGTNNLVERNKIYANFGAGVLVTNGSGANTITRNSIYANGTISNKAGAAASSQIGIDLLGSADNQSVGTAPFVTLNDSGDGDAGGNGLLNFPVFESAEILNGNLILKGFAAPGAVIELFIAAPDASGFGEGQTYLLTLNEGSAQDTDATVATYTSPLNGKNVGTDTTNRFLFTLPLPGGVSSGTTLTATATISAATSEFSNDITIVNAPPNIGLVKSVTPEGTQLPDTELTYTIAFTNSGGQSAANFSLTDPNPANTTLRLNNSTDFKVGSVVNTLGSTGLNVAVAYSNDGGATFGYTPVSGGGGAPAGYDRSVTHIRWSFTGLLTRSAPNNTGNVLFVVRIR